MAKKTVRVLRTLPLEGVIYRANDLVNVSENELKKLDQSAVDASKAAVDYCKKEGSKPVDLGVDPRAKPVKEEAETSGDAGEIVE